MKVLMTGGNKRRWALKVAACAILLATGLGVSLQIASQAAERPALASPRPALQPTPSPQLPSVAPLNAAGLRSVGLSTTVVPTSPGISGVGPGPAVEHVVPVPMPHSTDVNASFSTNWSGQILTGNTYTGVSGQWSVPAVVPSGSNEYSASWIGIDGTSSSSLIQTGTTQQTVGGITQG